MTILITGASGFVGGAILTAAEAHGIDVRPVFRSIELVKRFSDGKKMAILVPTLETKPDWRLALTGVDAVIHCAARVHVSNAKDVDSLADFRRVNVDGTLSLAEQAAKAGVRRFVFLSSIGVNGGETLTAPFRADDEVSPHSPYALSKHEAELGLRALAIRTGMEVVIIRPPLVYGSNAPGNFASLVHWLERGLPLPLGAIYNQRSFVALDNLVDLVLRCISHPAAANQTFLVSDDEDVSTTELLRRMGRAMSRPARLFPVHVMLLKIAAYVVGRPNLAQSLLGSLQVDISKTRKLLGWKPLVSVDEGLHKAVRRQH